MNKLLLVLILVVLVGGGYYMMKGQKPAMTETEEVVVLSPSGATGASASGASASGEAMMVDKATEFTVDGFEFGYDKETITVKKGDTVKITLTNSGKMPHDWVLDEFNAKTKEIKKGETDTITFVADTAGTFEYYCSVGNHRKMGMVGKLVVEE